jgi:hypothetical protein
MSVSADEFQEILRTALSGAVAIDRDRATTWLDLPKHRSLLLSTNAPDSVWLRNCLYNHQQILRPDIVARGATVELYGVDLPICNAIPRNKHGQRQIFVFDGLLRLIHYYVELITVLDRLKALRPDAELTIDGITKSEQLAFSMAGFAIMEDFLSTGRTPFTLSEILGPTARANIRAGYLGAVLFVLLHELGHLELGHIDNTGLRAELFAAELALPEQINRYKQQELEADAYSFQAVLPQLRSSFISNAFFFLGPFAFMETFAIASTDTHPMFVNRLSRVADLLATDADTHSMVVNIVHDSIVGFQKMTAARNRNAGDARHRIAETMPFEMAVATIREVKARVTSEGVLLDRLDSSNW